MNILLSSSELQSKQSMDPGFLAQLTLLPWRWRWYIPSKRVLTYAGLHGIRSQETELRIYHSPSRNPWSTLLVCSSLRNLCLQWWCFRNFSVVGRKLASNCYGISVIKDCRCTMQLWSIVVTRVARELFGPVWAVWKIVCELNSGSGGSWCRGSVKFI
jgi:hypothetical protein